MFVCSSYLQKLKNCCPAIEFRTHEPLKNHTSFRIGGPAAVAVFPATEDELVACVRLAYEEGIAPLVLGGGTNVLAPDEGLDVVVICLKEKFAQVSLLSPTTIYAQSGAPLAKVALLAAQHALTGLEFAHGIPGTVGGGVYMNAGAYGGELKDVIASVRVLDAQGNVCERTVDDCEFTYRNSLFQRDGSVILGAVFSLTVGEESAIREQMTSLMSKRRSTQPLEYPSAGSTFKRPAQGFAAALIENTGLKGLQVGDAMVSEKHAGFIINRGKATASDVLELMQQVQEKVLAETGVLLEPEVRILK